MQEMPVNLKKYRTPFQAVFKTPLFKTLALLISLSLLLAALPVQASVSSGMDAATFPGGKVRYPWTSTPSEAR